MMIGGRESLASHRERADRIDRFLELAHSNGWADSTIDIAGKIDAFLAPSGFTEGTVRDYTRAIVKRLPAERSRQREDNDIEDAVVELVYQESLKKGNRVAVSAVKNKVEN